MEPNQTQQSSREKEETEYLVEEGVALVDGVFMPEIPRVTAREAHELTSQEKARLVCAYEETAKFKLVHFEGAISMKAFRAMRSAIPKDSIIIFYCA